MKPIATWADWHEWCRTRWKRWSEYPFPIERQLLDSVADDGHDRWLFLRRTERASAPECRAHIQSCASTGGRWPVGLPDPYTGYFLAQRLRAAMGVTFPLTRSPVEAPRANGAGQIILWLLEDCWESSFAEEWANQSVYEWPPH
jgi:hypothetical protein